MEISPARAVVEDPVCLVVDDDDAMRMLAVLQLSDLGGAVEQAGTFAEALQMLEGGASLAMVVADRRLDAGTSGVDLLRRAAAADRAPSLFLMTAHVDDSVAAEAEAIGAGIVDKLDLQPLLDRWSAIVGGQDS